jgi:hypothetical protein
MPTSNKARPGGTSLSRPRPLAPPDSSSDAILRFQTHLLDAVGQAVIATDVREILDTPRGVIRGQR